MLKYVFKPYDPAYPEIFNKEKNRLREFEDKDIYMKTKESLIAEIIRKASKF